LTDTWRGTLKAVNSCDHPVRLTGKPGVKPLGIDGSPLDADCSVTLEMKHPGYVVLHPGDRAAAPVGWAGWDGPAASGAVLVSWDGARAEVQADGPAQPLSKGPATNLWSSWFVVA
jgi:hypothetical protein